LIAEEIIEHYKRFDESKRLSTAFGLIQFERSKELIQRYLKGNGLTILDIGGGCGQYTFWLAEIGHNVHLIDIVPHHIEKAIAISNETNIKPASIKVGNAIDLKVKDECVDAVLLFGPMYHLVNKGERLQALRECQRILKRGGQLFIHAICRYSGIVYGTTKGFILDEEYMKMTRTEVKTGHRANVPEWLNTFTEAHFHLPNELKIEIENCGLKCEEILGVIGLSWLLPNLEIAFQDDGNRVKILEVARLMEDEPAIGPDMLAICKKE
jgi:ubiquinone/menaquinone biosynthesis C-methylase UbiE